MIGRGLLSTLVLVTAGAFGTANGATPATEDAAVCTLERQVRFTNPITNRPTRGLIRPVKRGRISCFGTLAGRLVDGTGTIKLHGAYGNGDEVYLRGGDTCALGSGTVFFTAWVPEAVASFDTRYVRVRGAYSYRRVGQEWRGAGVARDPWSRRLTVDAFARHRADGRQDCFNTPLASALLRGQLVIRSAS